MVVVTQSAHVSDLIQAIEQASSPAQLLVAVKMLAASGYEEGIPTLIKVLGYNNPEAALVAVQRLIQFGDVAVSALIEQLDDYNYGARAYSFRALAAIANPQALDTFLSAAENDFAPSVRRAAAKGLGNLRWSLLPEDQQGTAQARSLQTLLATSHDPEWATRYAAVVGLQALALTSRNVNASPTQVKLVEQILQRFVELDQSDPDLVVRARVWLAQRQLRLASVAHSNGSGATD